MHHGGVCAQSAWRQDPAHRRWRAFAAQRALYHHRSDCEPLAAGARGRNSGAGDHRPARRIMLVAQPSAAAQARKRLVLTTVATLLAVLLLYVVTTYRAVAHEAQLDETRHADVIVVFGAAEYAGKPSPVYRARLDHAADLFQQGIAPIIITTGGAGEDQKFSEGGVGHDYLVHRGIPESAVIAETQGANTAQSAERVATIMKANGMHNLVAVSDAYHEYRIKRLLEDQGVTVFTAPRPGSLPHSFHQRVLAVLREAVSYTLWKAHVT